MLETTLNEVLELANTLAQYILDQDGERESYYEEHSETEESPDTTHAFGAALRFVQIMTLENMPASKYYGRGECDEALRLVKFLLAEGYRISVYDGEEFTVRRSYDLEEIIAALGTTGEDELLLRDFNKDEVGCLRLVWGNDPDGEELVADHSDNETINKLMDQFAEPWRKKNAN